MDSVKRDLSNPNISGIQDEQVWTLLRDSNCTRYKEYVNMDFVEWDSYNPNVSGIWDEQVWTLQRK